MIFKHIFVDNILKLAGGLHFLFYLFIFLFFLFCTLVNGFKYCYVAVTILHKFVGNFIFNLVKSL